MLHCTIRGNGGRHATAMPSEVSVVVLIVGDFWIAPLGLQRRTRGVFSALSSLLLGRGRAAS